MSGMQSILRAENTRINAILIGYSQKCLSTLSNSDLVTPDKPRFLCPVTCCFNATYGTQADLGTPDALLHGVGGAAEQTFQPRYAALGCHFLVEFTWGADPAAACVGSQTAGCWSDPQSGRHFEHPSHNTLIPTTDGGNGASRSRHHPFQGPSQICYALIELPDSFSQKRNARKEYKARRRCCTRSSSSSPYIA